MPCLCLCVYRVVCFFPVASLVSFGSVPELWGSVRLLLDPFFFLVGSQARWSYPWIPLLSLPCLVVLMLSLQVALPILLSAPLLVAMKPLTFETFLAKPLFGYVTRLLSLSYSVVSCRWRWSSFQEGTCYWNITISTIIINTPIYWAWVEGLAFCSVFCSTHATLGADKPALCSLILRSLHDGWMGTPWQFDFE